ncbi:MAG TPA: bacteriohemerythrin [Bacteroidota bacterium]|nr:bacteriohemerythrin [Bacteroidota bacterium]
MNWRQDFSVDISSMDRQHQRIIDLINRLEDAATTTEETKAVGSVLADLLSYTKYHFKAEEALMQRHNFPGLATHRTEHHTLVKRVEEFQSRYAAGKRTDAHDLANFLMGWLESHILGIDKKYSPYLVEKGVR